MTERESSNSIQLLRRSIAVFFAAVLLVGMLFSAAFIAEESLHDCTGEDCPICRTIALCEDFVRRIAPVFSCAMFSFLFSVVIYASGTAVVPEIRKTTLLSLKVRLNN